MAFGDNAIKAPVARGLDRKAERIKAAGEYEWKDIEVVHEVTDDKAKEGWRVVYVKDPSDLAYLGMTVGHCAGTHWIWACEEKTWYFFALINKAGRPMDTVHCKWEKWVGKPHPRDPIGRGYDETFKASLPADVGTALAVVRREHAPGLYSSGGYTTFPQVQEAFKRCGKEYEVGAYPATFLNATYGSGYPDGKGFGWDDNYGHLELRVKPVAIDQELWDQYTKLMHSMKSQFDKKNGNVTVGGRVFNFDNKKLIVCSYGSGYRPIYGEWLNSMNKKKKETASG